MLRCTRHGGPLDKFLTKKNVLNCAVCLHEITTPEYYRCAALCGREGGGQCCLDCWNHVYNKIKCVVCNTRFEDLKLSVDLVVERSLLTNRDVRIKAYLPCLSADQMTEFALRVKDVYPQHAYFACDWAIKLWTIATERDNTMDKYPFYPLFELKEMRDIVLDRVNKWGTKWWIDLIVNLARDDWDTFIKIIEWSKSNKIEQIRPDHDDRRQHLINYHIHCYKWDGEDLELLMHIICDFLALDLPSLLLAFIDGFRKQAAWNWMSESFAEYLTKEAHPENELGKKLEESLQTAFNPGANMNKETTHVFFRWYRTWEKKLPPGPYKYHMMAVTMELAMPSAVFWLDGKQLKQLDVMQWKEVKAPFETLDEPACHVLIVEADAEAADNWNYLPTSDAHGQHVKVMSKNDGYEIYYSKNKHSFDCDCWTQLIFKDQHAVKALIDIASIEWEVTNQAKRKIQMI